MDHLSMRRHLAAGLSCLFTLWAAGCGGGGGEAPPDPPGAALASITLSAPASSVGPGQTLVVSAVAKDAQGNVLAGQSLTWQSTKPSVAAVADGVVSGVAPGTAAISASSGSVTSNSIVLSVVAVVPPGTTSTSAELIAAALAAGTIDAETALTYKVFALFKDPRLPVQYAGDDSEAFESEAVDELDAAFDTASVATQDVLAPYMVRPSDLGSWRDPAIRSALATGRDTSASLRKRPLARPTCQGTLAGWASVDTATANVRVWYDTDYLAEGIVAHKVAAMLETKVWPTLIGTLGFNPPLDDSNLLGCYGRSGRLDVYIVGGLGARGLTIKDRQHNSDNQAAVYILIDPAQNLNDAQLQHTAAHEFTHAIHWAYQTKARQLSYGWFRDAFANWGADQVYPGNEPLNKQASCYFKSPHLELKDQSTGYCSGASGISRQYGGHLPLQFISKTEGPATVKAILVATGTYFTAIEAIQNTVPGGFKLFWPKFARTLWNQDPVLTKDAPATYRDWESFTAATPVREPVLAPDLSSKTSADLGGAAEKVQALDTTLNNLSSKYYHFTFASEHTRSVMFHNTFYTNWKNNQAVSVRAFFKVEGQATWDEEDWTKYEWIGFCRDFKLQRLEQLVIVFASGEWQGSSPVVVASEAPRLMRNVAGCWGFKGTATRTETLASGRTGSIVASFIAAYDTNPGGVPNQFSLESEGRKRVPIAAPLFTGGEWTLNENYSTDDCTNKIMAGGSSSANTAGGQSAGILTINVFNESLPAQVRATQEQLTGTTPLTYVGVGVSSFSVTGTVSGVEECPTTYQSIFGPWWVTRETAPRSVIGADGWLRGNYSIPDQAPGESIVYTWDLEPVRQP